MKPLEKIPGPGDYNVTQKVPHVNDVKQAVAKGGYIAEDDGKGRPLPIKKDPKVNLGPFHYNGNKEPKKISFLFNPSERWVS